MPLQPGTLLRNRYRIEDVLGQGGMGAVYHAYDVNLGVPVAVKENLFTTEDYARQFRLEATILASLRHSNLPRVTDHFVIEGQGQYLVMDFIEGEDLREILERNGSVHVEEALPWFLEICDALAYLHTRNPPVLHRDIKPGNIKIMPDGRAMLVDFGLAKVMADGSATTSGAKAMTPGFSPPEQYGTGRTDARTDIYSLAATMYAALTATIPEDSLERAMGRDELTPIRRLNPNVSAAMAMAIENGLAVRPDDRYQSSADFAGALAAASRSIRPITSRTFPYLEQTVVAGGNTLVGDLPSRPRTYHRPRRARWPVVLVLVLTLLVIGAGAAFAFPDWTQRLAAIFDGPTATENAVTITPTGVESPDAQSLPQVTDSQADFVPLISPTPEPNPEASVSPTPAATPPGGGVGQIAFASNRSGTTQIYLINIDGGEPKQLTFLPDGACQPDWSPNGSRLVFISPCDNNSERYPGSSLWILDLVNLEPQPLRTGGVGGDYDPSWAPGGDRIAFTSERGGREQIYLMDLDGSEAENLSQILTRESQPSWSPRNNQMLFVSRRSGRAEIWFMQDNGENDQVFSRPPTVDTHPDWSNDGQLVLFEREIGGIPRLVAARFEDRGVPDFRVCQQGQLGAIPMAEPRWSPDDRWIVFESWRDGTNHNIAIMSSGCTNYTELTSDSALDFDPAWRP